MKDFLLKLILIISLFYGQTLQANPSGPAIPAGYSTMPVVMSGSSLSQLFVYNPSDLVGFKMTQNGWIQIPIQIDERDSICGDVIYNTCTTFFKNSVHTFKSLQYCDANTWVGNDANVLFDSNDELVFMVKDVGFATNATRPSGVDVSSGIEIKVTNNGDTPIGYVYVFKRTDTNLIPSAWKSYVNYQFKLNSGDYKTTYKQTTGPNPESSYVTTKYYHKHFPDRWMEDTLVINQNSVAHLNMIDRNNIRVPSAGCTYTEQTFANSFGAFMVNKSGPVRAIRSYIGDNYYQLCQKDHFFYESMDFTRTYIRANSIPNLQLTWDYNVNAGSMIYNNNNNHSTTNTLLTYNNVAYKGMVIEGTPTGYNNYDNFVAGPLVWELINSYSGSVFRYHKINTDISNLISSSCFKDLMASSPCTGDPNDWGNSGVSFGAIPVTDPRFTTFKKLEVEEWSSYLPMETTRECVDTLMIGLQTPVQTVVSTLPQINQLALDYSLMPMVMEGSKLSGLYGVYPEELVGFKYQGQWEQIPIQIDKKRWVAATSLYSRSGGYYANLDSNIKFLVYSPDTNWGDSTAFDLNDELVFMLKDAGNLAGAVGKPNGVVGTPGIQVKVNGQNGQVGYIYLFKKASGSTLITSAGKSYVYYHYEHQFGDTTGFEYNKYDGTQNVENSYIHTPYYSKTFSNRWIENELKISKGDYTPVNLIDRQRIYSLYNDLKQEDSLRTEETFSEDEGVFFVNKCGPIRAIRSYMGANSGPYTQQDHLMYESLEIRDVYLRLHSGMSRLVYAWDMNPAAGVMVYNNNNNTPSTNVLTDKGVTYTGLRVDGDKNDFFYSGMILWELIKSNYGSILRRNNFITNDSFFLSNMTSIWRDDFNPTLPPLTGDSKYYGNSGIVLNCALPVTAPNLYQPNEYHSFFQLRQWNVFLKPETTVENGTEIRGLIDVPPTTVVTSW